MDRKQKKNLIRILVSAALLVLILVLKHFLGGNEWIWRILLLVPYFLIGYDVLRKAALGIWHKELFDECFLMTVATIGAMILGEMTEAVAVMLFYQTGEWFQSVAVGRSRKSIKELMDIRPDYANLQMDDGSVEETDPDDVEVGSTIVVKPGERIPIDGVVLQGNSSLNTAALTGEGVPRTVHPGDNVISGCINNEGLLKIRTTKEFGESTVSRILDLVENSSMKKAKAENFITKFARYYTPAVCYSALALAIIPPVVTGLATGEWQFGTWVFRALTFLVISCPCALVISIPLTFFSGIGSASRKGILVKGSNYLEALASLTEAVFDKTGTLTKGVFRVTEICPAPSLGDRDLLEYAAAAEAWSDHPIARGIRESYPRTISRNDVTGFEEHAGKGVSCSYKGETIYAGNAKLMQDIGVACITNPSVATVVYLSAGKTFLGSIVISDVIKEDAAAALKEMKDAGVEKTVMLTGDSKAIAASVAETLGISEYHGALLPDQKVEVLEKLLTDNQGHGTLAFIGDGINDAPVLSRADIGIAMGALGSDAAIEAADIVLMDDDIRKIPLAIRIARKCLKIVRQNIIFAIGVKVLCLIFSALGYANMWWAVFADVGVMVLAVLNAARAQRI